MQLLRAIHVRYLKLTFLVNMSLYIWILNEFTKVHSHFNCRSHPVHSHKLQRDPSQDNALTGYKTHPHIPSCAHIHHYTSLALLLLQSNHYTG